MQVLQTTVVKHIGGRNRDGSHWKLSQQQAIEGLESSKYSFCVSSGSSLVDVIVGQSRYGNKYLKTTADGEQPNNLLSLTECRLYG